MIRIPHIRDYFQNMTNKIELDKFNCKGCGACEEIAPGVFKMDETGEKADIVTDDIGDTDAVEQAAIMCPTKCIEIEKAD